jgi:2-keto-4-pentenoate hydratase/2-oxohepta-3-ene-1,7-dioic acid hydratase in catechol pathway
MTEHQNFYEVFMKYARADYRGRIVMGFIQGDEIKVLDSDLITNPAAAPTGERVKLGEVKLLAPCAPTKVAAIGINYRDHAGEMGHELPEDPVIFLKPATSVIGPEDVILRPAQSDRVDYEAECAVVIGKTCKNVKAADASKVIFGYTCCNDVTARDLQKKDGQWTRAKGFDTFCPLGPWIETEFDAGNADVESRLNGRVMQHSNTKYLINSIPRLVEFVSAVMTLLPGDVITTGTPAGIGPMAPGDTIEIEVGGIGILKNSVR